MAYLPPAVKFDVGDRGGGKYAIGGVTTGWNYGTPPPTPITAGMQNPPPNMTSYTASGKYAIGEMMEDAMKRLTQGGERITPSTRVNQIMVDMNIKGLGEELNEQVRSRVKKLIEQDTTLQEILSKKLRIT